MATPNGGGTAHSIKGPLAEWLEQHKEVFPNLHGLVYPWLQKPGVELKSASEKKGLIYTFEKYDQNDIAARETLNLMEGIARRCASLYNEREQELLEEGKRLLANIAQLEEKSARFEEKVAQLEEQRDTLLAQLKGKPVSSNTTTSSAIIPNPAPFDGEEKSTAKRAELFETWSQNVRTHWALRPAEFHEEHKKILFAALMLKGAAAAAVQNGLNTIHKHPNEPGLWKWKSGEEFLGHLATHYATIDLKANANRRFNELKQAGKFAGFHDFLAEFSILADRCEMDDSTKVRALYEKMSPKLRDALTSIIDLSHSDSFEKWATVAGKVATNLENAASVQKLAPAGGYNNVGSGAAANTNPDAMEIDAIRVKGLNSAMEHLPKEELERRMQNGLCLNCGQLGHAARSCRNQFRGVRGNRPNRNFGRGYTGNKKGFSNGDSGVGSRYSLPAGGNQRQGNQGGTQRLRLMGAPEEEQDHGTNMGKEGASQEGNWPENF
ncbi:hypothetical protein VTJ04DRAFT_2108 [Mycothermus thermophilus]|uniref:uncharacterized protein n=1 Tax=Humicola insolens TaxID=85995 RepID=UPI0037440B29